MTIYGADPGCGRLRRGASVMRGDADHAVGYRFGMTDKERDRAMRFLMDTLAKAWAPAIRPRGDVEPEVEQVEGAVVEQEAATQAAARSDWRW